MTGGGGADGHPFQLKNDFDLDEGLEALSLSFRNGTNLKKEMDDSIGKDKPSRKSSCPSSI